ncbi:MAG: hypothetical protein WDO14_22040 [Bacteroidota bacterium]
MNDQLEIRISTAEAGVIFGALSNLPYIQVHELIHNLQNQIGPQLAEKEKQKNLNSTAQSEMKTA